MENKQIESKLNLTDLIHVAYRWCVLLIAFTVCFGVGAYAYSRFLIKPTYVSTGNMYVSSVNMQAETDRKSASYSELNANTRIAEDYVEIIERDSILTDVAKECDSPVTSREIAAMLKASVIKVDSSIIQITVTADEPKVAKDVAKAVLKVASERLPVVVGLPGTVKVVEDASEAQYKKTPPLLHGLIGCLLGFILGILLVLFIELMDNRIKQTDNLSEKYNLPVIGVVPNIQGSREPKE